MFWALGISYLKQNLLRCLATLCGTMARRVQCFVNCHKEACSKPLMWNWWASLALDWWAGHILLLHHQMTHAAVTSRRRSTSSRRLLRHVTRHITPCSMPRWRMYLIGCCHRVENSASLMKTQSKATVKCSWIIQCKTVLYVTVRKEIHDAADDRSVPLRTTAHAGAASRTVKDRTLGGVFSSNCRQ